MMGGPTTSMSAYWDVLRVAVRLTTQNEQAIRRVLQPPGASASSTAVPAAATTPALSSDQGYSSLVEDAVRKERLRDVRTLLVSLAGVLQGLEEEEDEEGGKLMEGGAAVLRAPAAGDGGSSPAAAATTGAAAAAAVAGQQPPPPSSGGRCGPVVTTTTGLTTTTTSSRQISSSSSSSSHDDKCLSGGASPTAALSVLTSKQMQEAAAAAAAYRASITPTSSMLAAASAAATATAGGSSSRLGTAAAGDASSSLSSSSPPHEKQHQPVAAAAPQVVPVSRAEQVLGNGALVHVIFSFLIEATSGGRRQISHLAGVNELWRDLAKCDVYWRPIVRELFPLANQSSSSAAAAVSAGRGRGGSGQQQEAAAAGGGGSSSNSAKSTQAWQQVVRYGRSVVQRRITIAEWHEGISLTFEIFDEADGLRLFTAQGPIRVLGTTKPGSLALKLIQPKSFHSSPFSAASRDTDLLRFGSVTDYFTDGHDPMYAASLTVRVMATDERTGRMALVYSSNKSTKHWIEPMPNNNAAMPEGSLLVNQHWTRVATSVTGQAMQMLTVFFVGPVDGQEEDVPSESDRLYRVLETQTLYTTLQFKCENSEKIGKFIRGLIDSSD